MAASECRLGPEAPRYDALPYFLPLRLSGSGGLDNLGVRKLNYV